VGSSRQVVAWNGITSNLVRLHVCHHVDDKNHERHRSRSGQQPA
jgi:hypothetical protein